MFRTNKRRRKLKKKRINYHTRCDVEEENIQETKEAQQTKPPKGRAKTKIRIKPVASAPLPLL